ncbi:hypothetical protein CR513_38087, partial [Mucuna pruriens]
MAYASPIFFQCYKTLLDHRERKSQLVLLMDIGVVSDSTNQLERLVSTPISCFFSLNLSLALPFDSFKLGSELMGMLSTSKLMFSLSFFSGCSTVALTTLPWVRRFSIGFSTEETSA